MKHKLIKYIIGGIAIGFIVMVIYIISYIIMTLKLTPEPDFWRDNIAYLRGTENSSGRTKYQVLLFQAQRSTAWDIKR